MSAALESGLQLLFPVERLRTYFSSPAEADRQLQRFADSLAAAEAFHRRIESRGGSRSALKEKGAARALQYYKDETFLTLYAFAALDSCSQAEATEGFQTLLTRAFNEDAPDLRGQRPNVMLEKLVPPSKTYVDLLAASFRDECDLSHPVLYVREMAPGNRSLEGNTHADAILDLGEGGARKRVMFEAKFMSDISCSTKFAPERDQITRNLDAGLHHAGGELDRFWYVFVTPERFRERPTGRLYGYKLREYKDPEQGPMALQRELPYLETVYPGFNYAKLSRHIAWVTWEEVCGVVRSSSVFADTEFPRDGFELFFRERCLWPRG
jgi:hypothetical protein